MTASRSRRHRITSRILLLLAGAVLAVYFYAGAAGDPAAAARPYLSRARSILRELPAGAARPQFSSSTSGVGLLLASAEEAGWKLSRDPLLSAYLDRTEPAWARALRGLWAAMAAAALITAGAAARRISISTPSPSRIRAWIPAVAAAGVLGVAPLFPITVGSLSPGLPAGLLMILLMNSLLPARSEAREEDKRAGSSAAAGILGGILLAWYPFLWPVVFLYFPLRALVERRPRAVLGAAALALFLAVVLEPAHLVRPASILPGTRTEWLRAGGWSQRMLPDGNGVGSFLLLSDLLGIPAVLFAVLAGASLSLSRGRKGSRAAPAFLATLVLFCLALPALAGVRRAGAMQQAAAPALAAWGAALLGRLTPGTRGSGAAAAGGLFLLVGSAIPPRVALDQRSRGSAETIARVERESEALIGEGSLWLTDSPLSPETPADSFAARGFVIPRDSSRPGRYDFAYWPRWYAGFRWILLSGARVEENVTREDAGLPALFYRGIQADARLVREWGRGAAGYRLYRIPDGSDWSRPLSETELNRLQGGAVESWFVNQLGSAYLEAGDLNTAGLLFRQGIAWDPHAAGLYNNLGTVYLRQNDPASAGRTLEEGLHRAPNSVPLLFNLARACSEEKLPERAEDLLRRALSLKPDYAPAHYELGRVFLAEGKYDLAERALHRYLELAPDASNRSAIEGVLTELAAGRPARSLPSEEARPAGEPASPDTLAGGAEAE